MPKVLYEKVDRIAHVTINRPEAMNAIDLETHELLWETWRDFRDDDGLDVAILTGAGDEAFCAGADLKTFVPSWIEQADATFPRRKIHDGLGGITRGLHHIAKPIIAAVNGWTLAGGLETALACDIRIASERARFGSFEVRRGFHHGDGGIPRLDGAHRGEGAEVVERVGARGRTAPGGADLLRLGTHGPRTERRSI